MNIEPAVIYAAFGALWVALGGLTAYVHRGHIKCENRVDMLIEHNIAQQRDIDALMIDRATRQLPPIELKSQHTNFYRRHF